jgi:hypothetical protein
LRADIAYPQLSQQAEPGSPRSSAQQLSPRTVAASTRALEMERRQLSFLSKHARDLLLIAAGSPAALRVTARQLDGLRAVVMAAADPRQTARDAGPAWRLSSLVPSWRNGSSFALSIVDIAAWLTESLPPADAVCQPLPMPRDDAPWLRLHRRRADTGRRRWASGACTTPSTPPKPRSAAPRGCRRLGGGIGRNIGVLVEKWSSVPSSAHRIMCPSC